MREDMRVRIETRVRKEGSGGGGGHSIWVPFVRLV